MEIKGVHHIALRTAQFAALRIFYTETLGLPQVGEFAGRNIIFLKLGDTTIELIEAAEATDAQTERGWHHLALEVAPTRRSRS